MVRDGIRSGAFTSAHDIAEGGLAVALAECCIAGRVGASVELPAGLDPFAEAPGRAFLVSGPEAALAGAARHRPGGRVAARAARACCGWRSPS